MSTSMNKTATLTQHKLTMYIFFYPPVSLDVQNSFDATNYYLTSNEFRNEKGIFKQFLFCYQTVNVV